MKKAHTYWRKSCPTIRRSLIMNECSTATTCHFTPAASLAALGVVLEQRKVFEPIRAQVHIEQKTVKHTPLDKLYDSFITLRPGAHGLGEINTPFRADPTLQRAFRL